MNLTNDYKEFLNIIKNEFVEVMEENVSYYQGYDVVMSLEQEFIKQKNLAPNKLHFVVKFSSATVNYGQTILPVTITAMSEQNHCDVCQNLLFSFVQKFNLERLKENKVQQIYESPVVTSNFNKIYTGYSSILFVKGFFVISENANFFTYHAPILTVESPEDNLFLVDKSKFLRKIKDEMLDVKKYVFQKGKGETVLNHGFVKDVYFNVKLSIEEVVKKLDEIKEWEKNGFLDIIFLINSEDGKRIFIDKRFIDGKNEYVIQSNIESNEFIFCSSEKIKEFYGSSLDFIGWNNNVEKIIIDNNVLNNYIGNNPITNEAFSFNVGLENEKIKDIFSLLSFTEKYVIKHKNNGEVLYEKTNFDEYSVEGENGIIFLNYKEIPTISQGFTSEIIPDSQPFFNTKDMTKSIGKYGTRTINFSTFLLNNVEIINDCLKLIFAQSNINVNNSFFIKIQFTNMIDLSEYKLMNISGIQSLGEIPVVTLTFAI